MEPYSSSYISEAQDEERYYFSPACDEEGIVCLGSDSEQTPDEIARKHQRYEAEAQRFVKGKLPILQSASLRGPFDAGWVNPWRYRPKKKINEDWWQPGSEDMLFTRAKVMERAAAHGLGYLEPADALRWCKATAQAEAEAIHENNIGSGEIMRSIERGNLEDLDDMGDTPAIDDSYQAQTKHRPSRSPDDPDLSMLNHNNMTPHMSQGLDSKIKILKRAADSQWLKGSYVSKRARWEGPAIPSPTPLPEVLERERRRRQLSAKSLSQPKVREHESSRLSKSFPNHDFEEGSKNRLASDGNASTLQNFQGQSTYAVDLKGRISPDRYEKFGYQPDDFDELQDSSQKKSFRPAPQTSSKAKKIQQPIDDRTFSDMEPDDLIVITPQTKSDTGASIAKGQNSDIRTSNTGLDDSYDLPELPRGYRSYITSQGLEDGDSFITEVAPSSRNLEKFKFRKRRARIRTPTRRAQDVVISEGRQEIASRAQSQQSIGRYTQLDTPQMAEDTRASHSQEHVDSIRKPSGNERPSRASQATPPKVDESSMSWDLVKDVIPSPSSARVPQTTPPLKSTTSTSASPFATLKDHAEPSLMSSVSGDLLRHIRKQNKTPATAKESPINVYTNEMSTQSFNTTPPGSRIGPAQKSVPPVGRLPTYHFQSKANLVTPKPSEMDLIQIALSQICPSSSATDSAHKGTDGSLQVDSKGKSLESKVNGPDPLQTGSNAFSDAGPSQTRSEPVPGLPDMEFTSFSNESFFFLGDYLAETATTVADAPEDNQGIVRPPVVSQRRSPVSVKAAHGHSQLQHYRMDQESVHPNTNISCRTADILEIEPQVLTQCADEDVGAARDWEEIDDQDKDLIQMNYESTGIANIASIKALSEVRGRDRLSHDDPAHSAQGQTTSTGDESSFSNAPPQDESRSVNKEPISLYNASLGQQTKLSFEDNIEHSRSAIHRMVVKEAGNQRPGEGNQERKKSSPELVSMHGETAAIRRDDPRNQIDNASETSWEGCGTQSPWAAEKIELLPTVEVERRLEHSPLHHTQHDQIHNTQSTGPNNGLVNEDASRITIQRPSTPDYGGIKPFKDFSTPTPSPERQPAEPESNSMGTASLADAAMRNPWVSGSQDRSARPRKRVSFGIVPIDDVSPRKGVCTVDSTPRSPPPAQIQSIDQEEDNFHDGTTVTTSFNKHFVAASRPRQFKRILPEIKASQLNSSPAKLEAQAEAFIAADDNIPAYQSPASGDVTASRYLKTRSNSNTNSIWNDGSDGEGDESLLSNPFSRSPLEQVSSRQTSLAKFDMASVLGQAVGFLEDWSVDTVLKSTKEKESSNGIESNGMRRRKLFGLV